MYHRKPFNGVSSMAPARCPARAARPGRVGGTSQGRRAMNWHSVGRITRLALHWSFFFATSLQTHRSVLLVPWMMEKLSNSHISEAVQVCDLFKSSAAPYSGVQLQVNHQSNLKLTNLSSSSTRFISPGPHVRERVQTSPPKPT